MQSADAGGCQASNDALPSCSSLSLKEEKGDCIMKRTMLALLGVLLLSVAGSVIAQSEYGSSDQSAPNQPAATSTSDSTASSNGSASDDPGGSSASTVQSATADPAPSSNTHKGSLPKTASSDPLALALGLTALGSAMGLHLYRRRTSH